MLVKLTFLIKYSKSGHWEVFLKIADLRIYKCRQRLQENYDESNSLVLIPTKKIKQYQNAMATFL